MEEVKQPTVSDEFSESKSTVSQTISNSQSTFLVTLLSVLLLISVFIAGFFAYQTQRLVLELRTKNEELEIKNQTTTATFVPSPVSSETPFATSSATPITNDDVACTMDAKICPDGSAVGRSGPKCEFDPCPTQKPTTSPQP